MQDFTENFERLEDIQGKYPPGTLVLRAQFVYMLQDQFRDLERDYGKISEMYVAEMEKAAKLEQQVRHEKSEADKVISELEEKHKKEVAQLLMKISSLEKLVETADKLLKQKGGFTIKDIKFGGVSVGSNLGTSSKEAE